MITALPMARRRAAALFAALPVIALAACARSSAEDRLRGRIAEMQDALKARKPAAFMAGVAADFSGPEGLDRAGIHNLLRLQFLRHAEIGATLGPIGIEMQGSSASVTFKALSTGGDGSLLPQSARGWDVQSAWRDGADGWQVVQAEWEPVL